MNADGTDVRRITFEGAYNASPNWSPRGDKIVFVSQVRGLFKIATVNPDGSDFRLLTNGRGNDENPSWSPSGRQIVFSSNREGRSGIYIMNADGTDIERITPNDANYTRLPGLPERPVSQRNLSSTAEGLFGWAGTERRTYFQRGRFLRPQHAFTRSESRFLSAVTIIHLQIVV
jgi:Tol biopolymer transport system component